MGSPSNSSFTMLLPFSKNLWLELIRTHFGLLGFKITWCGVLPNVEASCLHTSVAPRTHISGYPLFSAQIQHSSPISKSLKGALRIRRKPATVCASVKDSGSLWRGKKGVESKRADLALKLTTSHTFVIILWPEK